MRHYGIRPLAYQIAIIKLFKSNQHTVMTDSEYLNAAELALTAIELSCDRINDETDADIDNQRGGGMITVEFAGGSQLIVNLQKPLQEIWLAAKSGGFHYRLQDGMWRDTKTGNEFFADISLCASEQSGLPLTFG